jgi:hypothetical protein
MCANAKEGIQITHKKTKAITWKGEEKEYFSKRWQTKDMTNISLPIMTVLKLKNLKSYGSSHSTYSDTLRFAYWKQRK